MENLIFSVLLGLIFIWFCLEEYNLYKNKKSIKQFNFEIEQDFIKIAKELDCESKVRKMLK